MSRSADAKKTDVVERLLSSAIFHEFDDGKLIPAIKSSETAKATKVILSFDHTLRGGSEENRKAIINAIGEMIKLNQQLMALNLSCNHLRDGDMPVLLQALAQNPSLIELNLKGNFLTVAGLELLAAALEKRTVAKTTVNIEGNIPEEKLGLFVEQASKKYTKTQYMWKLPEFSKCSCEQHGDGHSHSASTSTSASPASGAATPSLVASELMLGGMGVGYGLF